MWQYTEPGQYGDEFGARVYKISRDEQGNRLTHLKVTGGRLQARQLLQGKKQLQSDDGDEEQIWSEKINQIRIYSGEKFEAVQEVEAGRVCAVTGLENTRPGQGKIYDGKGSQSGRNLCGYRFVAYVSGRGAWLYGTR